MNKKKYEKSFAMIKPASVKDSFAIKEELKFQGPAFRNNLPSEIDTEVLTRRVEELNFIAEK